MNVCRKAKVIVTKKKEFNSKIRIFLQDFLVLLKSLYVKSFIEKKTSWYDMRPLDQKGLNIWVWNCIKELCKESGEVLGLTSNHLKVGPPQTLRASPSWHFPKNASTFTRIDILLRSTSAKPYFVHFGQKNQIAWKSTKGTIAPLELRLLVWHKRHASLTIDDLSNFHWVASQPLRSSTECFVLSSNQALTIIKWQ